MQSTNLAKIILKIDSVFHQAIKSKMIEKVIHFHKNLKNIVIKFHEENTSWNAVLASKMANLRLLKKRVISSEGII